MFVNPELARQIKSLLADGRTQVQAAAELGVSQATVSRYVRRLGYRRGSGPGVAEWSAVRRHYDEGHSVKECRARFGCSQAAWDAAVERGTITLRRDVADEVSASTREAVAQRLELGWPSSEIAEDLGLAKSTVVYHRQRLGYSTDQRFNRRYDWSEVQRYHDDGHTARECIARFGFSSQTWHKARERGDLKTRPALAPIETYLVKGRRVARKHLKARLIAAGLKTHACEVCGIREWRGRALSMCLHHINGDKDDNRLENLQFLCGNCHSQTPNFGSLNWKSRREAA